jgi:N-acetylmuramoyl-L-alanine amidase
LWANECGSPPATFFGLFSGRTTDPRGKAQAMQMNLKSLCVAGSLITLVLTLILADCPPSFGNHRQDVAVHQGTGPLGAVSVNPAATREELLSAIQAQVEGYRKKGPQSRAPRDLLLAGEAYLKAYRTWHHREDLDSCIRLMGEFTRAERRGPEFIAGLTILKEAHLLKRKIETTRPASARAAGSPRGTTSSVGAPSSMRSSRAGDSTLPQSPDKGRAAYARHSVQSPDAPTMKQAPGNRSTEPQGSADQTGAKQLEARLRPGQACDAVPNRSAANVFDPPDAPPAAGMQPDESSAYRYTGNPFCGEERGQSALPINYLVPKRSLSPEVRQPLPVQPGPSEATVSEIATQPPPPPVKPVPEVKSASLPPSTVNDATPQAALAPRLAREFLIVLDPGHGGKDPGAVSEDGSVKEKEIALEVAKRVKQRLASCNPSVRVELTRTDDRFLALEERTALANAANADLFISIHCNADTHASSKGVETFYLSKATSRRAMRLAARENGISLGKMTDVEATLLDLLLTSKKCESDKLASIVHGSLLTTMKPQIPSLRDRGVKPAPFYVLLGAQMPAILVECAFISNARDRVQLTSPAFLDSVATGIADGAVAYLGELGTQK